ncbi:hypothetical protein FQN54_000394 [Arachnomyces sp. PD_36]|nr:hypothetical protein FQN54_000394 [Arachnomyces sp. PD_36]
MAQWTKLAGHAGAAPRAFRPFHNDFPMPRANPDLAQSFETQPTVLNSSHPTQDTSLPSSNKENLSPSQSRTTPPRPPVPSFHSSPSSERVPDSQPQPPPGPTDDALPPPLLALLSSIKNTLHSYFTQYPPHTIQRLAELILRPTSHYRTLPAYLRAVDRVVSVSSGADIFPLPVAMPIPGNLTDTGLPNGLANGASSSGGGGLLVADNSLGSDEALGGALLTPIPWLTDATIPGSNREHVDISDSSPGSSLVGGGLGPVPTREAGGVTQGELIRQEQEAGVVPTTHQQQQQHHTLQLQPESTTTTMPVTPRDGHQEVEAHTSPPAEDGEEIPHARGPAVVGVEDMGLQDGKGVEMSLSASEGAAVSEEQNLRQAAAVVRQVEGEESAATAKDGGDESEDMLLTDADAEAEVVGEEGETGSGATTAAADPAASGDGEGEKDAPEDEKMGL